MTALTKLHDAGSGAEDFAAALAARVRSRRAWTRRATRWRCEGQACAIGASRKEHRHASHLSARALAQDSRDAVKADAGGEFERESRGSMLEGGPS